MTATTFGSELSALAELAGLNLDEQSRVLEEMCSVDQDGNWLNREYVVTCGGEILDARALAGLFLFGERTIIWVCSVAGEANASFRRIARLVEASPELRQHVARIRRTNGDACIELHNGSRLICPGRPLAARGLCAETVLIDGLLTCEDEMNLYPVLAAARNPQRVQRI